MCRTVLVLSRYIDIVFAEVVFLYHLDIGIVGVNQHRPTKGDCN